MPYLWLDGYIEHFADKSCNCYIKIFLNYLDWKMRILLIKINAIVLLKNYYY